MDSDIESAVSSLDLKVLTEFDEDYGLYVARCLETGAVATGNTQDEATALIRQTLELDILLALRANNLEGLFQTNAPADVRARWYMAKASSGLEIVKLNIPDIGTPKRGIQSELRIAKTREHSVA